MTTGQAVVVGATGTLGAAIVNRFTGRGVPVVAVARDSAALDQLASGEPLITACAADIADDSAIERIGAALTGPVRIAVFAPGLGAHGSVDSIRPQALAEAAEVKLGGLVRLLRAVRDRFTGGSRFVAFAGSLGAEPKPHTAVQGAVNAGVFNLMRQIADRYGPLGVTTHVIAPGPVDSPRLRALVTSAARERGTSFEEVWQQYQREPSRGALPTVAEVAWAVELLLDPEAAVLHGGVLTLDGGVRRGLL
ncbi:SDR family NAD(P)-dependent oxidoreductase [Amycolatopsis thermoflava]|uniref:SDR family NAD(P)-dependent oxidoreductase n=1 Tax=Amycolatopsis thermoflava TaxID=84480 RepID=UPI003F4A0AB4